jgi:hypothetical protein
MNKPNDIIVGFVGTVARAFQVYHDASLESKAKIRATILGRRMSDEVRAKICAVYRGRVA